MKTSTTVLRWPQLLTEVGTYLFGEVSWQRQLAEALQHPHLDYQGVDAQTLKKWVAGRRGVPWWVPAELLRLVQEAREEKKRMGSELYRELLTQTQHQGGE